MHRTYIISLIYEVLLETDISVQDQLRAIEYSLIYGGGGGFEKESQAVLSMLYKFTRKVLPRANWLYTILCGSSQEARKEKAFFVTFYSARFLYDSSV